MLGLGTSKPLGTMLKAFFSGGTPSKGEPAYWDGDIPWASPKDFGSLFLRDTEDHVTVEAITQSAAKIALKDTVLIVVRSGVLAHTLPVAVAGCDMAINQDLKALVCKDSLSPRFLAVYLRVFGDRILPIITKHGVTVQSVNTPEFRALPIPVLKFSEQERLARIYVEAIKFQNAKMLEADTLLASIDDYLLSELDIVLPPEPTSHIASRMFRVTMRDVQLRHDPNFFGRKYVHLTEAITARPYRLLREICSFSSEAWDQNTGYDDTFPYLEISAIDLKTGDVTEISDTPIAEAPSRARMVARPNDILVSTTRPSRGAITLVPKDQAPFIASTGFVVIRTVDNTMIDREYLYCVLRSKLGLTQMEQRSSGGNYPAITPSELKRIEIPLPDMATQKNIVSEIQKRKSSALSMRSAANAELEEAKREIEAILLGDAP